MKIITRTTVVYNMALFILFSYLYIILLTWPNVYSLDFDVVLDIILNKLNGKFLIPIVLTCCLTVFFQSKISKYILVSYFVFANVLSNSLLFFNFDKIVLLTNFFFLLTCYYIYEFWQMYLSLASFNPSIKSNHIITTKTFKLKVSIIIDQKSIDGYIVNYDSESCFIMLEGELGKFKNKILDLNLIINNKVLSAKMKIVSKTSLGIGLFGHTISAEYLWYDIYTILKKRGYFQ